MKLEQMSLNIFSMRGINSHLNFDLNLTKDQSRSKSCFLYIQYAYARSVNIINKSKDTGLYSIDDFDFNQLSTPGNKFNKVPFKISN